MNFFGIFASIAIAIGLSGPVAAQSSAAQGSAATSSKAVATTPPLGDSDYRKVKVYAGGKFCLPYKDQSYLDRVTCHAYTGTSGTVAGILNEKEVTAATKTTCVASKFFNPVAITLTNPKFQRTDVLVKKTVYGPPSGKTACHIVKATKFGDRMVAKLVFDAKGAKLSWPVKEYDRSN